jgi:hypothetical protein
MPKVYLWLQRPGAAVSRMALDTSITIEAALLQRCMVLA